MQTNEGSGEGGDGAVEIGACLCEQSMARISCEDEESVRWLWSLLET